MLEMQSQRVMLTYSHREGASCPLYLQSTASHSERLFGLQSDAFNPVEDPDSFDDMYACDRSVVFFSSCMHSHLSHLCFG